MGLDNLTITGTGTQQFTFATLVPGAYNVTVLTQPSSPPGGPPHQPRIGERTNQAWAGETAGFYYVVVDAMLKTGFTPDDIAKIGGGNFLRVFSASVGK